MARKWRRHDPFVVRLVQRLVNQLVMQSPMYPVYAQVGEGDEERELEIIVESKRRVGGGVVELRVAAHFQEETRRREDGHDGHGDHGLADLEPDLVFEVFGVRERGMVEDEDVGEGGKEEVDHEAKEPVGIRVCLSVEGFSAPLGILLAGLPGD